jgi:phosphatidylglycerol---prolipoprotein diacylglyceryl transferase
MLPVLQIGPLTLRTPGLALLAGVWLALEVAQRAGTARGIDGDRVYSLGLAAIFSGVIGARLSFVLINLPLYLSISPWSEALRSAFSLAPGTEIGWLGVLIAAGVVMLLIRRWRLPPLALLDAFAPAAAIALLFMGLANLLSGDMYGMPTSLPWGINLWGLKRHPTQLLLMLTGVVMLLILWRLGAIQGVTSPARVPYVMPGFHGQLTLIMISLALLLIEPLRADSPVIFDGIRAWQVIGLIGLVGGLASFMVRAPGHPVNSDIPHEV